MITKLNIPTIVKTTIKKELKGNPNLTCNPIHYIFIWARMLCMPEWEIRYHWNLVLNHKFLIISNILRFRKRNNFTIFYFRIGILNANFWMIQKSPWKTAAIPFQSATLDKTCQSFFEYWLKLSRGTLVLEILPNKLFLYTLPINPN